MSNNTEINVVLGTSVYGNYISEYKRDLIQRGIIPPPNNQEISDFLKKHLEMRKENIIDGTSNNT